MTNQYGKGVFCIHSILLLRPWKKEEMYKRHNVLAS